MAIVQNCAWPSAMLAIVESGAATLSVRSNDVSFRAASSRVDRAPQCCDLLAAPLKLLAATYWITVLDYVSVGPRRRTKGSFGSLVRTRVCNRFRPGILVVDQPGMAVGATYRAFHCAIHATVGGWGCSICTIRRRTADDDIWRVIAAALFQNAW